MHSQRSRSDTEAGQAGECARGTEDRQTDRQTARRNEWHPTDNMPDHASRRRLQTASTQRVVSASVYEYGMLFFTSAKVGGGIVFSLSVSVSVSGLSKWVLKT